MNRTIFFQGLTALRNGSVSEDVVRQALEATRHGRLIANLVAFDTWLQERFPDSEPFFNYEITSQEGFPRHLVPFVLSLTQSDWSKVDIHGVYAVYGKRVLDLLSKNEARMQKETYRDELAGAYQHYANGLMHAAKEALEPSTLIDFPCFTGGPWSALRVAQEAVRVQSQSCNLRSEKYASPGTSKSHVHSFKSSIENLATALEVLAKLEGKSEDKTTVGCITQLRDRAKNLVLVKHDDVMRAYRQGEAVEGAIANEVAKEKRSALLATQFVPARDSSATKLDTCAVCKADEASYTGIVCRCRCICAQCVLHDMLMECPTCSTWTEFLHMAA